MLTKTAGNCRWKRALLGSAVGALLAGVTLMPDTSWLVRQQVQTLFSGPVSPAMVGSLNRNVLARQQQAAAAHPQDFPLQMALALRQEAAKGTAAIGEDIRLVALRRLEPAYADEPSLYAAILRNLSRNAVKLDHRTEQDELETPRADRAHRPDGIRPEALSEWLRATEQGGQRDPDNAFFPLMRAIGLFAGYRDAEAVEEIKRAGAMPRYEDYTRDEATGGWALAEAGQNGALASLPRVSISAATLMPHYAVLRAAARLTAVQAVYREQAGRAEEGFAIRQALARCGARLRTDSNWLIGNFVGEAIAAIAQARPGGAPPIPRSFKGSERAALRVQRYTAYLGRIGHSEEIPWVTHGEAARREIHATVGRGLDRGASSIGSLMSIMVLWAAGIGLLGNALWMVLLGALAAWLARTLRSAGSRPVGQKIRMCGSVAALLGLLYWTGGSIGSYVGYMDVLIGFQPHGIGYDGGGGDPLIRLVSTSLLTCVPLLTVAVLAAANRIRRVPVWGGTVRGFARASLPITVFLALAYVGVVGATSVREAAAQKALVVSVQHEGRACAAFVGRAWPSFGP